MDKKRKGILSSVVETAGVGLESARDLAASAGSAVGEAVSNVTKRARKMVTRKRPTKRKATSAKRIAKGSTTGRKTAAIAKTRRSATRKVGAKKSGRKTAQTRRSSTKTGYGVSANTISRVRCS